MKIRAIAILLLGAGAAAAQIAVPRIGCFVDGARRVRPVYGVAGNFLLGDPEAEQAVAAVCSDGLAVIKRDESIEIRTRGGAFERPAPAGSALFGLSEDGSRVLVFFPESGEWLAVGPRGFRPLDEAPPVEGEALAIGAPEQPGAVVRKDGEAADPVLLLAGGGRVTARGADLVLTNPAGEESTVALPGRGSRLDWLGPGWVRVRLAESDGHLAFSIERNQVYRLPEAAQ